MLPAPMNPIVVSDKIDTETVYHACATWLARNPFDLGVASVTAVF
jgi:hypothetical protein